ncbi:L-arabinose-binding periplasmic protein precursor AraF [Rhodococcus aetherivorans]|uniref:L-arabinose-binding periplasmic protein AraF n=1 Tax=Rhodococcus aetherivorans TaxID=191292 RepID=A0ABQ0YTH7_9NOCA|nr:multiple monosaccharide ABC transporter substrate-binding protein [Rhodococcus aetherivorans]ETT25562.1 Periplasmic binding protein domain containing protein [Rhodococcus rhodochrous ATCC 21198]GES39922.1 L-arabinose-binding periplasmic protein precursor AraF [Rhodococcus aetherivorans]
MQGRSLLIAATAATALVLAGCGGPGAGGGGGARDANADPSDLRIGISLPSQDEERWISDSAAIEQGLADLGYQIDLQFANNDIPTQQQQVDQMITQGADLLILAPLDGTALSPQLQAAEGADIPIISYDRLIRNSDDVDLYVTFDNFKVGAQQATSLLRGLGVLGPDGADTGKRGPFNVELFGGSLDDNNATFVFNGAMSVLQPYLDNGTLVVKSAQTQLAQIATENWSQQKAQERMDNLLTAHYSDGSRVDAVLTPNDSVARGAITALQNAGYGPTLESGPRPMPITTGQDAEIASVKMVSDGVQYSTVFKDTRVLADQAVHGADDLLKGKEPELNDTESYDNGAMIVPSFLVPVHAIYRDNIDTVLVDSGYYTAQEVQVGRLE